MQSVFFPARPRPYLEYGITQGDGADDASDDDTDDDSEEEDDDDDDDDQTCLNRLARNTRWSSHRLGLNYAARRLAHLIARRAFHMDELRDCTQWSKAAVPVFVASHLVRHPVSPEQISTVTAITRRAILDTYRLFYPERETVIDRECLFLLREDPRRAAVGSLPSLAWPPPGYTDAFWEIIASRLEIGHGSNVIEVSRQVFTVLVDRPYFDAHSVMNIAALSIYLASCLRHSPISCRQIASATGASEGDIRTIYTVFYPHREDLLENRTVDIRRTDIFESTLNLLPREVPSHVE